MTTETTTCACRTDTDAVLEYPYIVYCPTHAAAPEMVTELLAARAGFAVVMNHALPNEAIHGLAKENFDRLGALLRRLEP